MRRSFGGVALHALSLRLWNQNGAAPGRCARVPASGGRSGSAPRALAQFLPDEGADVGGKIGDMRTVPTLPGPEERILDGVFEILGSHVPPGVCAQHVAHLRGGKGIGVLEGGKQARTLVLGILQVVVVLRVPATCDGCARGPGWHPTGTQICRGLGAVELDAPIVFGPRATMGDRGACGGGVATVRMRFVCPENSVGCSSTMTSGAGHAGAWTVYNDERSVLDGWAICAIVMALTSIGLDG